MKTRHSLCGTLPGILLGVPLLLCGQGPQASSPNDFGQVASPPAAQKSGAAQPIAPAKTNPASVAQIAAAMTNVSSRVADILRMKEAGVDPQVLAAFVEHSPGAFVL